MDTRCCFLLGLLSLFWVTVPEVECQAPPQPTKSCNFDNGTCGYKVPILQNIPGIPNSNPAWIHGKGPHGPRTGPTGDHTSGSGKYMYIPTAGKGNKKVSFWSVPVVGDVCVSFYYRMNGPSQNSVGELNVYKKLATAPIRFPKPFFTTKGSQGHNWKKAKFVICVPDPDPYLVEFSGEVVSRVGDIAIDDVTIGFCPDAFCECQSTCPPKVTQAPQKTPPPPNKTPTIPSTIPPTTQATTPSTTQSTTNAPTQASTTQASTTKPQQSSKAPKGTPTPSPNLKTPAASGGPSITIEVISATGSGMSKGTQVAIGIGSVLAGLAVLALIFSSRRIMKRVQENDVQPLHRQDVAF